MMLRVINPPPYRSCFRNVRTNDNSEFSDLPMPPTTRRRRRQNDIDDDDAQVRRVLRSVVEDVVAAASVDNTQSRAERSPVDDVSVPVRRVYIDHGDSRPFSEHTTTPEPDKQSSRPVGGLYADRPRCGHEPVWKRVQDPFSQRPVSPPPPPPMRPSAAPSSSRARPPANNTAKTPPLPPPARLQPLPHTPTAARTLTAAPASHPKVDTATVSAAALEVVLTKCRAMNLPHNVLHKLHKASEANNTLSALCHSVTHATNDPSVQLPVTSKTVKLCVAMTRDGSGRGFVSLQRGEEVMLKVSGGPSETDSRWYLADIETEAAVLMADDIELWAIR
ncbi:unnamed protein product [Vitrella brassicaformis CCMP3155]|uniref:Uncharacterized protein n=1 Tax=Vitrella brassicaformis (strain CCMP3155) TaxID=1169540 RepID=A0A0G4G698_VITBC|nr:unnamed protein product [Vitrella brassicaformis CCMP3155]|eukprot:CEM23978.1 unnamed protein product [Vitrella brassicaformis CCMP3155]